MNLTSNNIGSRTNAFNSKAACELKKHVDFGCTGSFFFNFRFLFCKDVGLVTFLVLFLWQAFTNCV